MLEKYLVSLVLPVYNIEEYLPTCMDSVLSQTYYNLQIILVDDGSTDGSPKLCDYYAQKDSRVLVYHKTNGGLSDARNFGISKATGEFISFIDPDDFIDLDYVKYLVTLIDDYKTDLSICQHRVIFPNGEIKDLGFEGSEVMPSEIAIKRMLYHDVVDTSAWGKLYKRELFEGIEFPFGMNYEDICTTYKLFDRSRSIACGNNSKYSYIIRSSSIVNGVFSIKKLDLIKTTDMMAIEVSYKYPDLIKGVVRRQVYARISTYNQMLKTSSYKKEKNEIVGYIRSNGRKVLIDKNAPLRDKIAIILLYFGTPIYNFVWSMERKGKGYQ